MKITQTIQCRHEGARLVWRHPCEEFTGAVQLIVNESQEALFYVNGQALDLFGAGSHVVGTHTYPELDTYLTESDGKEKLFHAEVYFVNRTVQSDINWGLSIHFLEPTLGVPFEIGIHGKMYLQVSDTRKLIIKLLGTGDVLSWGGGDTEFSRSLQKMFLPIIADGVRKNFAPCVRSEKLDIFTIDEYLPTLAEVMRKSLLPTFEEYGLFVPKFLIESIVFPESDPTFKAMRELKLEELKKAVIDSTTAIDVHKAEKNAEVVGANRAVAIEEKKTDIVMAQMNAKITEIETEEEAKKRRTLGAADADVMEMQGVTAREHLDSHTRIEIAKANGRSSGGWRQMDKVCTCGEIIPSGKKFCSECGKAVENNCPNCGEKITGSPKFCAECGAKL